MVDETNPDYGYYEAVYKCLERYHKMLLDRGDSLGGFTSSEVKLMEFIFESVHAINDEKPLLKLNRWLGYIQGTLIAMGITDVETERNWTRPLFRPLDFPED